MLTDRFRAALRRMGVLLADTTFPTGCTICGQRLMTGERFICTPCLESLPRTRFSSRSENPVAESLARDCSLVGATAFLYYRPSTPLSLAVRDFKYGGRHALAYRLGQYMGESLAGTGFFGDADALVPVPMHRRKQLVRGYNQTDLLAEGVADAMGIPVMHILKARRAHATQTRKTHEERARNVRDSFAFRAPATLPGHAVIIDDIFTTGATVRECARTLAAAAPQMRLSVLTLGFAGQL